MSIHDFERETGMKPPERMSCLAIAAIFFILIALGLVIVFGNNGDRAGLKVFGVIIISSVLTLTITTSIEKVREKKPKFKEELEKFKNAYKKYEDGIYQKKQATIVKYNIPQKEVDKPTLLSYFKSQPEIATLKNYQIKMIWVNNNSLYIIHKDLVNNEGGLIIPIRSIKSFLRQGDMYIETNISGGGGGGTSIAGAVVGDLVAGPAGAVIGSRKKVDSIKTENKVVDNRQTILEFEYNNTLTYLFFDSNAYDIFLNLIPEKEITFVNSKKSDSIKGSNRYDALRELSKLKDEDLITDEEFNSKKKQILGL